MQSYERSADKSSEAKSFNEKVNWGLPSVDRGEGDGVKESNIKTIAKRQKLGIASSSGRNNDVRRRARTSSRCQAYISSASGRCCAKFIFNALSTPIGFSIVKF